MRWVLYVPEVEVRGSVPEGSRRRPVQGDETGAIEFWDTTAFVWPSRGRSSAGRQPSALVNEQW